MGDSVDFTVIQVDIAKGRIWLARTPSAEEVKKFEDNKKAFEAKKAEANKKSDDK
jgi:hypothetical protein